MNSQNATIEQERSFAEFREKFLSSKYDWFLLSAFAGLLPLLIYHGLNLWQRPHFQFFPLAWLAFGFLVCTRSTPAEATTAWRQRLGFGVAVCALLATTASVLVFSPWLAHVSLIFVCLAWMILRLPQTKWYLPLAWLTLLVITLPMPRNLDTRMVQQLQRGSTESASALLDLSGIPHFISGNVLEIRTGQLFVDEACSGVDSLYALGAIALLLALWHHKPLLLSVLLLASVPLWAWLGNVIRLYTIAYLLDRWGIDWSHGWQHTLLGLGVFAFSYWNLTKTQQMLEYLLVPFPARTTTTGKLHKLYNRVVCWPGADPTRPKESSRPSSSERRGGEKPETTADHEPSSQNDSFVPGKRHNQLALALSIAFLILGSLTAFPLLGIGPWEKRATVARAVSNSEVDDAFTAELLPQQLGDATQTGFETQHRERGSIFGEHSATWQYRVDEQLISLSLDFPFAGFHGLEECYVLSGGELISGIDEVDSLAAGSLTIYEGRFVNDLLEINHLFYTEFEEDGTPVTANSAFERGAFALSQPPVTFQLQAYVQGAEELSEDERKKYHQMLEEAAKTLLPTIQSMSL